MRFFAPSVKAEHSKENNAPYRYRLLFYWNGPHFQQVPKFVGSICPQVWRKNVNYADEEIVKSWLNTKRIYIELREKKQTTAIAQYKWTVHTRANNNNTRR